jgi:hypothetical protein
MKIFFCISFFLFSNFILKAQKIDLIYTTAQPWSGGVCCFHGMNYVIRIQTDNSAIISIDTVYLNNKVFYNGSNNPISVVDSIEKNKKNITIYFSERHDERNNDYQELLEQQNRKKSISRKNNCVVYHARHHKKILEIVKIIELPTLAYP